MTSLRQRMINDMTVRGLAENTKKSYLSSVTGLACHYNRSPARISAQEVQDYLIFLHEERGVAHIYDQAKEKAGVAKPGGIHTLRHCYATGLLEAGVELHVIQRRLGHTSIRSTMRYLHLAHDNPALIYRLLFKAASQTLLEFGRNPRWLGGELGITMVLHTWGQNLGQHIHVHCIVTDGGLSPDGQRWMTPVRKGFLFVRRPDIGQLASPV